MKKIIFAYLAIFLFTVGCTNNAPEAHNSVPVIDHYVNDYANMLSPEHRAVLESRLKSLQDSTSDQFVVLTMESYDDENQKPLVELSADLYAKYGIGQKSKNNGVLLIVVKKLASKDGPGVRVSPGRGLEGVLTDLTSGQIARVMHTYLDKGQYVQGVDTGVGAIIATIKGEYKVEATSDTILGMPEWLFWILLIIVVVGFFAAIGGGSGGGSSSEGGIFSGGGDSDGGSSFSGGGGGFGGGGAGD